MTNRTSPTFRKRTAGIALSAALALTAAACASTGSGATAAASGSSGGCTAPAHVTIAENTIPIQLSLNMAEGLGDFKKVEAACHTTISFDVIESPTAQIPALFANQVQFIAVGTGNILSAAVQGKQFLVLLSTAQGGGGVLVANAADKSKGTGVDALKNYGAGTTWAVASLGGPGQLVSDALLQSVGVNYKDVNYVPVGTNGLVAAVAGNKAQVGYASSSQAGSGAAAGQTYSVMYTASKQVYEKLGFFSEAAFATQPSFAKQYPELTQQIVNAEVLGLKATRDYFDNAAGALKLMPASYQSTTDASVWASTWKETAFTAAPLTGLTTEQDLNNELNLAIKYGVLPAGSKLPAGTADPSWVTKAYQQLNLPAPTGPIMTAFMNANSPE
jgi:ABC-type nitrate/sulfonate/bicarbonate transport system substrate-binding protein